MAGPDQDLCAVTSTSLAATPPVVGQGVWTQVAGPNNAVFSSTTSPTATVSGLLPGASYTFRWTVSNGGCQPVTDDVEIGINQLPSAADAGVDQTQFNSGIFVSHGNTPAVGLGTWSVISGSANISDDNDPSSNVSLTPNTSATLVWTINNANCPPTTDTVILNYVSEADIIIEKTVVESGPYLAGQDITYRIVVRNAGPSNDPAVFIRDNLPANFAVSAVHVTATGSAAILSNQSTNTAIVVNADIPVGTSTVEILVEGKIASTFEGI